MYIVLFTRTELGTKINNPLEASFKITLNIKVKKLKSQAAQTSVNFIEHLIM